MLIQSQGSQATRLSFSFNPQDSTVSPPQVAVLDGVDLSDGVSTDKVKLRNLHLLTDQMGQPMGLETDENFELSPNAEGDFVFDPKSEEFTKANAFAAVAKTVSTFERHLQEMTGRSLDWAFEEQHLGIAPQAGLKIEAPFPNAFYTRFELTPGVGEQGNLFFFDFENGAGEKTSSANSGEVVAHEAGHAILDALRPNYFTSHAFEAAAFHEAFGDMVATLAGLDNEQLRSQIVEQTGGDLSRPSVLSNLGEELGAALGPHGVRDNLNTFQYVNPDTLPHHVPDGGLARESHSFGRVFSAAFYQVLDGINDLHLAEGVQPEEALRKTSEDGWRLLVGQMENATESSFVTFEELAHAMVQGDMDFNDGKYGELIEKVFMERNLITGDPLPEESSELLGLSFEGDSSALVELKFPLPERFGELAGVTVSAQQELNIFKSNDDEQKMAILQKEIAELAEHGEIFIPAEGEKAQLSDFIRADGSHYHAYLDRENNELKRVPLS